MPQLPCPLGASYFVARSAKQIHVGGKAGVFQAESWKDFPPGSVSAARSETHSALGELAAGPALNWK